jgi:hypothetical protein
VLKTFKETIASLQDKKYGSTIIKLPFKQALWYWSKYFILVSAISALVVVGVVTYFAPQVPRLLRQYFPEASFTVKNGTFSTSLKQPAVLGPADMPVIIDTAASTSAALDSKVSGILFLKDKIIFKSASDSSQTQSFSDFPDFSFSKNTVVSWISGHQTRLWLSVSFAVLVISVFLSALFWLGRILGFALWSLGFWLVGQKIIKRDISYTQAFNIVLYASVLPYLMDSLLILAPSQLLSLLSLAVFVYFGASWLVSLPKK